MFRTRHVLLTASVLLGSALFVPPTAHADSTALVDPADVPVTSGIAGNNARALAASLGDSRTGGVFLDDSGRIVVNVTDEAAAQAVRDAGGVPKLVTHSMASLNSIHTELDKLAGIPGTSWGVDPSTNQVSVELDSTVSAVNAAKLAAVTGKFGDAVRVDRIPGKLETGALTTTTGGQAIQNVYNSIGCSLGFNVENSSGVRYFLTAGHCVADTQLWYQSWSGYFLGYRSAYSWPGNDIGVVRYDNDVLAYGTVHHDTQQITRSRWVYDGEPVKRAGGFSNDLVGAVLLTNTTVTYDSGETLYDAIKTSNCMKHGDSGGALYHADVALGLTSGGNGLDEDCSDNVSDRRSYYQPVQEALNAYHLSVY